MEGREHFNISEYRKEDGTKSAYEFKKGEMPLRIYNITHPEVNLTKEERERFIQGLESTFGKYYREKLERNLYNHEEE
jgi:hypothetical protein